MYPTHTLLAQVAADRTADAERRARAGRQRRFLALRRSRIALFAQTTPATASPQAPTHAGRTSSWPTATSLTRPRSEAA
jgi:hypothetical protein